MQIRFALIKHTHDLGDIEDFSISSPADGDLIEYDSTTGKWINVPVASLTGIAEAVQDIVGAMLLDTASVNLTYNDGTGQFSADVLPAGVDHNSLLNYVADRHVAHTGVVLTAGAGLTGGGDISVSRTLTVGAGTGITVNADDVALSATTLASLALADSSAQPGDGLSIFTNDAGYITSASLPTGANPSATIGLSAVNGSATTFLRSDGAPALDQAIAPSWSGAHVFGAPTTFNSYIELAADYGLRWFFSGGATDEKRWAVARNGTSRWELVSVNDAFTDGRNALSFSRTGMAVTAMEYGNTANQPTHSFYGKIAVSAIPSGNTSLDVVLDGATSLGAFFHGPSVGIRFSGVGTEASIEGVDETGFGSYEPIRIGGSQVSLLASSSLYLQVNSSGVNFYNAGSGRGGVFNRFASFGPMSGNGAASTGVQLGASGSGYAGIGINIEFTATSGVYNYGVTDTAGLITLDNGGAGWHFHRANSGTAGTAITFTELAHFTSSGEVRAGDGSASAPTFSFLNQANTGIYRGATSQVWFSEDGTGHRIGFRDIPRRTSGFARGECLAISAGVTLNTSDMAAGYSFTVYNDSASAITITQGSGVTLRLVDTATTGNRTLAARGMAFIWCNSGTEAVISGVT